MKRLLPVVAVFLAVTASAWAQDVSAQKAVYDSIEKNLGSYKKVKAKGPDGAALTGWIDTDDVPVKILAKLPGESDEFFTGPDGKLAFVYREWTKDGAKVEERFYMDAEGIVKWLSTEKNAPVMHGEDYREMWYALIKSCVEYSKVLAPEEPAKVMEIREQTTEVKSGATRFTEGKFLRIDEGDYFHWVMKDNATGEEATYFILKPDASVEAVVSDPEKFVGKKCRVTWKESTERIPEAGQKMDVQQILSVDWAK
ncbi:hypothetical protein TSACC_2895 [Terrimicrobium sacchariphilum]|uniref:Uncharacterized protein n=1 Tax=Terrimicrobium sacchariphilum TaxID=690879 RepID=A0A146G732_TERSA|nr:hypothetical protein [Terrimicrobium sacchariphilum]GAT32496.1 hypothetical protein TSACC_2895 [Terrimicrobium sacchariphilum]